MRNKLLLASLCFPIWLTAQVAVPLKDMSFWKTSSATNWQIAGDVTADFNKRNDMTASVGTGVLVNLPNEKNRNNLVSAAEYGDVDVTFDFMMARHSNSGFYLMGRYEVQLLDSWGVKNPKYGDCGGIYKRRRYAADSTEILWEGHAPLQNACLAPGLWQHIDISFQAPRFDATGKKIANAKYIKITMNGIVLHENVELTGPTGGPIDENEAATGPFMIQGDHGPVAFRNLKVSNFNGKSAELSDISFNVYYGTFKEAKDFLNNKPDSTGKLEKLTWEVSKETNDFAQVFKATLKIPQAGKYKITTQMAGKNAVKVGNKVILPENFSHTSNKRIASVDLPAGDVPIEMSVYKTDGWMQPILGLWIEGSNFRPVSFHSFSSLMAGTPPDPIFLNAPEPTVFRSFMDFNVSQWGKVEKRIVHAVNVGSPDKLHFTYDMDNGALAQVWKGDFLNTSPMWDDRGDGSSRPRGTLLLLNDAPPFTKSVKDTLAYTPQSEAQFRTLGYNLAENGTPTFRYRIYGSEVEDEVEITEGGKSLSRTITLKNTANDLFYRVATGKKMLQLADGSYLIDDKKYYVKLMNGAKGTVETVGDNSFLIVPVKDKLQYSIMW